MNDYKELLAELRKCKYCARDIAKYASDAIEQLVTDRNAARNELCGYCGQYKEAHIGACDGCKWRASE